MSGNIHQPNATKVSPYCPFEMETPLPETGVPRLMLSASRVSLYCIISLSLFSFSRGADHNDTPAISAKASENYSRIKLADGSYQPETYTFGEGGMWASYVSDSTLDKLKFITIARILARPLAKQNYVSCKDPKLTKLLIMVYWGMSTGGQKDPLFHGGVPDGRIDALNVRNAKLLGYDSSLNGVSVSRPVTGHARDLIDELEDNRYFVIMLAYDFQLLWKEKRSRLLWETRFSIREQSNDFGEILPEIANHASPYFGQNVEGLVQKYFKEGDVKLGELKFLEIVPEKSGSEKAADPK